MDPLYAYRYCLFWAFSPIYETVAERGDKDFDNSLVGGIGQVSSEPVAVMGLYADILILDSKVSVRP